MEKELKIGDIVQCLAGCLWENRIFIKHGAEGSIICVSGSSDNEKRFKEGHVFHTSEWLDDGWRYKKQTKYVPYDINDVDELRGMWVKNKDTSGYYFFIHSITRSGVYLNRVERSYAELLENYTKIDGSPCGKLEDI